MPTSSLTRSPLRAIETRATDPNVPPISRLQAALKGRGLDTAIATSYENVAYLTGAPIMTQRLIPERLAVVVVPRSSDPIELVCNVELREVASLSSVSDVRQYTEFQQAPLDATVEILKERGAETGVIGVEARVLSMKDFVTLSELLPQATLVAADDMFDELRVLKTASELDLLERAAMATDRAIDAAFSTATVGTTDSGLAVTVVASLQMGGADVTAFLVVGAGPTAGLAHPTPRNRPIAAGDVVRFDVGGTFKGYFSDLARTGVVGRPAARLAALYESLYFAQRLVIQAIKPGLRAGDAYRLCERYLTDRGIEISIPHIGHSIGLGLHEHPILHPRNDTPLAEGMVFCIEPAVRDKETGATIHIEDTVAVTRDGSRVLSRSREWEELTVI